MTTNPPVDNGVPFGSWSSPISAQLVAAGGVGVGGPAVRSLGSETSGESSGSEVWWSELRPTEGGRVVLVSRSSAAAEPVASEPVDGEPVDSEPIDRLPEPWSARTRVHEYGGGAWWLGDDGLFFAEWTDQRLYRLGFEDNAEPEPVTPEPTVPAGWRYADGAVHPDGQWLVCVREDHHPRDGHDAGSGSESARTEPRNEIVAIALTGEVSEPVVLATGHDFVAAPRFSADGRWLSWVRWDHPNMPWDATTLCAAPVFANMRVGNVQTVAGGGSTGGPATESIHGAGWTSDGRLVFSSDRNGYWNLYAWHPGRSETAALTELTGAEIGGPPWVFGVQRWVELDDGRLVVAVTTDAVDTLGVLSAGTTGPTTPEPLPTPGATLIGGLSASGPGRVAMVAAGPRALNGVVDIDTTGQQITLVRPPDDPGVDPGWFSEAQAITYESAGRQAHAFFYPPTGLSPTGQPMTGPEGSAPPLIVMGHGGPTSHAGSALNLKVQYWTSRGFAVVDVNYGGSSGFGRAYRDLLQGTWGIVDVEDCINAARHLADAGMVDRERLAIRGGSAGGFTVLAALVQSDDFAAGTSLYGVADLTALAADTHKFESRYLDGLVGPYPARRDRYEERSPINSTDQLSSPLLVLQGLEDEIVPPNQSEAIVDALAAKGVPHAYVPFEGEQHGFRRAENIIRSFEVELWFYGRILGFQPNDEIEAPAGAVGMD